MTRIALKRLMARPISRASDALRAIGLDSDQSITAAIQLLALVTTAAVTVTNAPSAASGRLEWAALGSATGLAILRVLTIRKRLAPSTIVLDAVGTVVLLAGTGAPLSPYFAMAIAGIWWAAHLPVRGAALTSAAAYATGILVLVVPASISAGLAGEALGKAALLAVAGVAAARLVGSERWSPGAGSLGPLLETRPAIHEGLSRSVSTTVVPVEGLLAAGRAGLTAVQTELLAYLMLGLANLEIADAIGISEATVRYRLTGLYKVLGVRGRKAAAARGRELGLDQILPSTAAH
jgi:DNA-binding CsgD family transcriptional regulator